MGSSSSPSSSPPPPPPMIGRAGNLTVFITPPSPASTPRGSARAASESPRPDFSTPTPLRAAPSPAASPSLSPSPKKPASPPAVPVVFTPPPPPVKVAPPPVQVPPPQYEKAGKHDGSAFGFFWDTVTRVQEAHASLDGYVANWFGLDQSRYQWALNDYYEATGKDVDCVKPGKPKEVTAKVQKV